MRMVWLKAINDSHMTIVAMCVNFFKLRHNFYMCTFVCMTKQCQIPFNFTKIPPTPLKVKKPLQCGCHFGMVISPPPVGRFTWPRDRNVARGRYYIRAHQSRPIFSRVVAVRFTCCVGVRHCNGLWSHCTPQARPHQHRCSLHCTATTWAWSLEMKSISVTSTFRPFLGHQFMHYMHQLLRGRKTWL